MAGKLEDFWPVDVAGECAAFLSEGADLDAAAGSACAGVGNGLAVLEHFLDDDIGVEDRGLAEAGADYLAGAAQEAVRILFTYLDARAGLSEPHLLDDIEYHIRQVVDGVASVLGFHSADVYQRKIGIGSALLLGDSDFGRRRLIVKFDPEALEELFCLFGRQRAFLQARLIEGPEVLVEPARVE